MQNGETSILDAPAPIASQGTLVIATNKSLVSAGTERMLVDFGKASYFEKARQQPEKVRMVLDKIRTDGLLTTYDAVMSKLSYPIPLGYCNVGTVIQVGNGVNEFKPGDRVVSNGPHADIVKVTKNLCAHIPDSVDDETASFTIIASIGLQGIRLAAPTLGEYFVVTGVGLIGLITVQLLISSGCKVLAIDYDKNRLDLAKKYGAEICDAGKGEDPVNSGMIFSKGNGVDGVIITASTKSSLPVSQAAQMCRKKGRIILVGVTGLELNRAEFYEKEISFQVSCSYGPGRYDPSYEEKGNDYPIGFVRWTEKRNFEAVLNMMESGKLELKNLITHRFSFEDAKNAYKKLSEDSSVLGLLLNYSTTVEKRNISTVVLSGKPKITNKKTVLSFIGAGNYASRILIPAFRESGARMKTILSQSGLSSVIHGAAGGFEEVTTEVQNILNDKSVNAVVIATRHDTHGKYVEKSLKAGKHVFVEKPLCITYEELNKIEKCYKEIISDTDEYPLIMVGYNRRFSPQIKKMKYLLDSVKEPKVFIMTMNSGNIPPNHWTQDNTIGGGRIIGEACHYIDLMRYLADSKITSVQARRMGDYPGVIIKEDKATITLGFENGSFGTILYLANGAANFPKERIEVFTSGRVLQLDNFRKMTGFGWPGFNKMNLWKQDKGQKQCTKEFVNAIEHGISSPIPYEQIMEVSRVTIDIAEMLRKQ